MQLRATTRPARSVIPVTIGQPAGIYAGGLGDLVKVGIGTTAPQNQLEVTGPTGNISGLRLTNFARVTGPTGNGNVLSVDADGDVILVRYQTADEKIFTLEKRINTLEQKLYEINEFLLANNK